MASATLKWYYYTGSEWVDISGYVLTRSGVSGNWGMSSNNYTDKVARIGEMRLLLDNGTGRFDPDDADVLTGWALNTKVKFEVTFDGETYRRFYGVVTSLKFTDENKYDKTAQVVVSDWMHFVYNRRINQLSVATFRTADYAVDAIVDAVGVTPLAENISDGSYVYDAVFDSMTTSTTAATELNKIVLSENGYFYVNHDKVNGETLRFETNADRTGMSELSVLPKMKADCGYLLMAGTTDKVLMAGSTDKIILSETQAATINESSITYERSHGENVLNKVNITVYPKRVDTTAAVLYSLGTPLQIAPGETKVITARYQNASTKESCNAITSTMIAPVATTDYTMNDKKNGTGTDKTAYLAVTASFTTSEVTLTLVSTSTVTNYITKLQCRGYGVYMDSEVKYTVEDTASQTAYGMKELNINQMYQRDTFMGQSLADELLFIEKNPRTKLNVITMIANKSDVLMLAFCNIDIGDIIKIAESDIGVDSYYYIQGIDFQVIEGNVIAFKWILSELEYNSYISGELTSVTIEADNSDNSVVDFGYIPELFTSGFTIIASIYPTAFSATNDQYIFSNGALTTYGGYGFGVINHAGTPKLFLNTRQFVNFASYYSDGTTTAMSLNNWYRVAVTYNVFYSQSERVILLQKNPLFQINGEIQGMSTVVAPSGGYVVNGYGSAVIGGAKTADGTYSVTADTKIKDVCIYNKPLSFTDVAADAASPCSVTNNLVFRGMFVPTVNTGAYYDAALTQSQKLFDAVFGRVGTPKNAPYCREIT